MVDKVFHTSCCAVHNAPALPLGPCDCGAVDDALVDHFAAAMKAKLAAARAQQRASGQQLSASDLLLRAVDDAGREHGYEVCAVSGGADYVTGPDGSRWPRTLSLCDIRDNSRIGAYLFRDAAALKGGE